MVRNFLSVAMFPVRLTGEVLATILPPIDKREKAKKTLSALAKTAVVGDIVSPSKDDWKAMK